MNQNISHFEVLSGSGHFFFHAVASAAVTKMAKGVANIQISKYQIRIYPKLPHFIFPCNIFSSCLVAVKNWLKWSHILRPYLPLSYPNKCIFKIKTIIIELCVENWSGYGYLSVAVPVNQSQLKS